MMRWDPPRQYTQETKENDSPKTVVDASTSDEKAPV
jgi:hypothetical protein